MKQVATAVLYCACVFHIHAQPGCDTDRFRDTIFSVVDLHTNLLFGENLQPTLFDPNATQKLYMDIYQPDGDTVSARPLILWAFGGAFVTGTRRNADIIELSAYFAKAGYVCAAIDYRLTPELFFNGNPTLAMEAVLKATHDMRAAVRYFYKDAAISNNYRIDTTRIFLGGVSAGGVTALHAAYLNNMDDLPSTIDTTGLGGLAGNSGNPGYSYAVKGVINLCGGLGDTAYMKPGDPVLVSLHGTNDQTVPYGSDTVTLFGINWPLHGSASVHHRADILGIPNRLYTFKDAGHTPFYGTSAAAKAYMDTTLRTVRDFLLPQVCDSAYVAGITLWYRPEALAFPVPATQQVEVIFSGTLPAIRSAWWTDVSGRQYPAITSASGQQIYAERGWLPPGLYLLSIATEAGMHTLKVVWQ